MTKVKFQGFNVYPEVDLLLRLIAAERRVSKAEILREAVDMYLRADAHKVDPRSRDYTAKKGVICPYCGFDQIEANEFDVDEGCAYQYDVTCLSCGERWTDVYLLIGFQSDEPLEDEE